MSKTVFFSFSSGNRRKNRDIVGVRQKNRTVNPEKPTVNNNQDVDQKPQNSNTEPQQPVDIDHYQSIDTPRFLPKPISSDTIEQIDYESFRDYTSTIDMVYVNRKHRF